MKRSEIFKALEDGEVITHMCNDRVKYKLVDDKLYIYCNNRWVDTDGLLLLLYPDFYEIKSKTRRNR